MKQKNSFLLITAAILLVCLCEGYNTLMDNECIEKGYLFSGSTAENGKENDDYITLENEFVQGMEIYAINYCTDSFDNSLKSLQIELKLPYNETVGEDQTITLKRHGKKRGNCR